MRNLDVSEAEFSKMIGLAMDELPQQYIKRLQNVVVVVEDEPTKEQRQELKLHCSETLFGLYKGVPLTMRGGAYSGVLPDKITLFRLPMLRACNTNAELFAQIKHTLWHEIAHYYGLDHDRIHAIEDRRNPDAAAW